MDSTIKVKNVKINNLKNIKFGEIKSTLDFDSIRNSEVIGIYGQNGSGKTAYVEAFSILKTLLTLQSLPNKSNHLILYNQNCINLAFEFIISNKFGEFFINYQCSLEARKERLVVTKESFYYKENLPYKKPKPLIEKDFEEIRIRNKGLSAFDEESRLKILLAKEMATSKNTSFVFSKSLRKIWIKHFNKEEIEVFKNIFFDFNRNLHIIDDKQTGLILANIMMPFAIHLKETRGKIPYGLTEPMILPPEAFSAISNVIKQINIVLFKIIPGLQIIVNPLNNETLDNGKSGIRFEFLSKKDNKNLPLRCESAGILKLISILSTLIAVFNNPNSCVIIDELDSGIFEYLLGELLEIINENGKGQLFFTSHNLRALEILPSKNLWFTTTNEDNRFIRLQGIRKLSNSRDIYIRAVQLGGQKENLYRETDYYDIKKAFRQAGKLDV